MTFLDFLGGVAQQGKPAEWCRGYARGLTLLFGGLALPLPEQGQLATWARRLLEGK